MVPSAADAARVAEQQAANPEIIPYFLLQHDDYVTIKSSCVEHILAGLAGAPAGVATLETAIEAMKLAEAVESLAAAHPFEIWGA